MPAFLKFSTVAGLVLLVIMALGPENWQPRTGLGWEFDHFFGYFVITHSSASLGPARSWLGQCSWLSDLR
jgi:hypothetical protein